MAIPYAARLPSIPLSVRTVRRAMADLAADCGMNADMVAAVQLAVTEAAANVVMHAYADATGELTVTAVVEDGELAIIIGDSGLGFDERRDSPGLGVGLSLIATVAEQLRIVTNPGGTQIRMTFPCPSAAGGR